MQVLETLTYIGRNRRSDECVIENQIELETGECEALLAKAGYYRRQLSDVLQSNGIPVDSNLLSNNALAGDAAGFFACLYAHTALAIQRAAGHKVYFATTVNDPNPNRKRVVFEYEQSDVGLRADMLALNLLTDIIPELHWSDRPLDQTGSFAELFVEFREFARPLVLPADAQVIIDAAARLEVPCVKLEREPYQGLSGDFRIRKNGLLKLGHSSKQHIVDGTFCIDRGKHLLPLLRDREQLFQIFTQLEVPVACQDNEFRNCRNARRAARSAASIGYPVVVKPWIRSRGQGVSLNIRNEEELRIAVRHAQQHNRKIMVEKYIEGDTFKVIVANDEIVGVMTGVTGEDVSGDTHPTTQRLILDMARKLGVGLLVVDVVSTEIGDSLQQNAGAIVDVDLAPELDRFLPDGCNLHARAMSGLVQWLYPPGVKSV